MPSALIGPPLAGLTSVEVDGCVSIYAPQGQQVVVLNATASDIWQLADGEHTLAEIAELLGRAYREDPATLLEQVAATVDSFVEAGLLDPPRTAT